MEQSLWAGLIELGDRRAGDYEERINAEVDQLIEERVFEN